MKTTWVILGLAVMMAVPHGGAASQPSGSVIKLVQAGRKALAAGERDKAKSLADSAIAQDSGYAEAWKLLGAIRLQGGDTNAAAQAFRTALLIAPRDPAINRELGWLLWADDREKAIANFDVVVQTHNPDRDATIRRILGLLAETQQEVRALELYYRWKPGFTLGDLGVSLATVGRHEAAYPFLQAAYKEEDESPLVLLYLASLESRKGQRDRALTCLKAFLSKPAKALKPDQEEAFWNAVLGVAVSVDLVSLGPAIETRFPSDLPPRTALAARFEATAAKTRRWGEDGIAAGLYRQALLLDPNRLCWADWVLLLERIVGVEETDRQLKIFAEKVTLPVSREGVEARLAHYAGKPDEAIAGYRKSLARAPGQLALQVFLIRELFAVNRGAEAREEIRKTEALNSKTLAGQDRLELADFWYEAGDLARALELDRNLLVEKARARAMTGDWEGALRLAQLAVTNDLSNVEAWKQMGLAQSRLQNYADARVSYEHASVLSTNDAQIYQELGWALWSLGEKSKAREVWEKAVALGGKDRVGFVRQVVARMAEDNQKDWALELHERWLPETRFLATGLELFRAGRMKAAEPFLVRAWDTAVEQEKPIAGLYLGRARSINGVFAGTPDYFVPFISSRIVTASVAEVTMVVDGLRMCSGVAGVGDVLDHVAAMLVNRPDVAGLVTDLYLMFARDDTDRRNYPAAMNYYEKALARDPNRLIWPMAYTLTARLNDPPRGEQLLSNLLAHATAPAVKCGVEGELARLHGDFAAARAGYETSLKEEPAQPDIHRQLFDLYLKAGEMELANREADWMQSQVESGDVRLREILAMMRASLGQDEKAMELWQLLHLSMPDDVPYYGTELAMAQYRTGRATEAIETLKDLVVHTPLPLAYELTVQMMAAVGRNENAVQAARQGLVLYSSPVLRRGLAENLEVIQTPASASTTVAAAEASVQDVPDSSSMSLLVGRSLASAGRNKEAAEWHQNLLKRNPEYVPSLMFLRDYEIAAANPRRALPYSERLVKSRPQDGEAMIRYAMNLAEADGFSRAIRILEPVAKQNEKEAMAILLYSDVSPFAYPGLNTMEQIVDHIGGLAKAGYHFSRSIPDKPVRHAAVMLILVDPDNVVVDAVDAALKTHHACAVMIVNPVALDHALPRKPTPVRLAQLEREGRWTIGVTSPDLALEAVRADGVKGNALTHRILVNGVIESPEAMSNRVGKVLSDVTTNLKGRQDRFFYYPGGDYGHLSLDTDPVALGVLSNAVGSIFTGAFCRDDAGFLSRKIDRCRLPAKTVPAVWRAKDLLAHLKEKNPVVEARLELAKLFYWHGQSETASYWFGKARDAGADPFEIVFNQGANAAMEGDLSMALRRSREAVKMAPAGESRPSELLEKAMNMRRPTASLGGGAWWDNEDRSYWDVAGEVEGPVRDWLRWQAGLSHHHWEKKNLGSEEADRGDLGFLAYVAPEVWMQAGFQEWIMGSLPDIEGWQARLHLPNPWFHGNIELTSQREMMDTVEALQEGITAHREGIETYSRLMDFWDCFVTAEITDRSDGNSTWWAYGKIIRRLKETPYLGLGYAGRFADSSEQVPEYWSPEQLQQHQAYAAWQGTGVRWNGQLSGQAGYAKELNTNWRFVWGTRAVAGYKFTSRLSANGTVTYQGGPVYDRTSVDAYLNLRW